MHILNIFHKNNMTKLERSFFYFGLCAFFILIIVYISLLLFYTGPVQITDGNVQFWVLLFSVPSFVGFYICGIGMSILIIKRNIAVSSRMKVLICLLVILGIPFTAYIVYLSLFFQREKNETTNVI